MARVAQAFGMRANKCEELLTADEILQFDRLIFEAHKAFRLVPDFHGFDKPKHHSAAHVGPFPCCALALCASFGASLRGVSPTSEAYCKGL